MMVQASLSTKFIGSIVTCKYNRPSQGACAVEPTGKKKKKVNGHIQSEASKKAISLHTTIAVYGRTDSKSNNKHGRTKT